MTFQLDMLIAIAFLAPVVFFAILNVLAFRTRGYESAVKPVAAVAPRLVHRVPATVAVEAANDSEIREAA
jgi:hypothetical protein